MIRRVFGFALFAVAVRLVLKIALGILGTLIGLAVTVLVLAALGYVYYLVLRVFSPAAATPSGAAGKRRLSTPMAITAWTRRNPVAAYLLLACAISWIAVSPLVAAWLGLLAPIAPAWHWVGALGPITAAVLVT